MDWLLLKKSIYSIAACAAIAACGGDKKPANVPPVAVLSVAGSALLGEAVVIDATGSYDPDGSSVSLTYDFGDGVTGGGGELRSLSHAYAVTGDYFVTLTVKDIEGAATTVLRQVNVRSVADLRPMPTPCFVAPSSGFANQTIVFDGACSTASDAALAYYFDFGDGTGDSGRVVAHAFSAAGIYRVSLLVTATYADATTAVATMTADVAITDATIAIGAIEPSNGGVAGGEWITIKGQGFTTTTDTTIAIGGQVVVDFTVVDSHTITLRTPAGISGAATVQVRNSYGLAELLAGFTYLGGGNRANVTYCPIDATAGGTSLAFASNDDDAVQDFVLPFAFPWFDTKFAAGTIVHVSSNGTLSFSDNSAPFVNSSLPSAANPNNLVAAFFDDLNIGGGQVYARTTGESPNRVLTFEWKNVKDNASLDENLDFQVSLYESSGDIKMQYRNSDWNGTSSLGQSATIGLQQSAGEGHLVSHNNVVLGLAPGGVVQRFAFENANYVLASSKTLAAAAVDPQPSELLPSGAAATVTFTKPLNFASVITGDTIVLQDLTAGDNVPIDATLLGDKSLLQLTPKDRLLFGHQYMIKATTGLKDVNGNPLSQDPEQLACGAVAAITDFTSTFIAGPQLIANSNGLPSGGGPIGLAVYTAANGKSTVIVAKDTPRLQTFYADDLNTNLSNFTVGSSLWDVVPHPGGTTAYVSDSGSSNLRLVNIADPTNLTSQAGSPIALAGGGTSAGLALLPDGSKLFVANDSNNCVHVINVATKLELDTDGNGGNGITPITVTGGCSPYDVAVSNNKVYVTCDNTDRLVVINSTTYAATSIVLPNGANGHGIVAHPSLSRVFVADNNNGEVIVVDTASDNVLGALANFNGGAATEAMAITNDGIYLIVTDTGNDEVAIVDWQNETIIDTLSGFGVPMGAVMVGSGYQTIISNFGSDRLASIE